MSTPEYSHSAPSVYETNPPPTANHPLNVTIHPSNPPPLPQLDGDANPYIHPPSVTTATQDTYPALLQNHHINNTGPHRPHPLTSIPPIPPVPAPAQLPPAQRSRQHSHAIRSAVHDLLPYCTTEPPLTEAQVIALSDVVGSLEELAVLALAAASGDVRSVGALEGALGRREAVGVMEFFGEEWEVEG